MLNGRRVAIVLPAYNAGPTLARTVAEIDRSLVDELVLVDDASTDDTIGIAERLGLEIVRHPEVRGYGGNQKSCYATALGLGADVVVMVHPDYQYSPLLVPALAAMIAYGQYDLVLGSRILAQNPVAEGMPRYKYLANRFLTVAENLVTRQKLSEYHTGLRAFSRELLAAIPFDPQQRRLRLRQPDHRPGPDRRGPDRRAVLPDPLRPRLIVDQSRAAPSPTASASSARPRSTGCGG